MANSAQARKRARQDEKRRLHNSSQMSSMRTAMKKALASIEEGKKELANQAVKQAMIIIDRIAGRGLIHPNKAARLKSRLNRRLKVAQ